MFRKIVAVWVSLAMLFGFVVIVDIVTDITPSVKAATITVDDSGGANYLTIQEGIDAANPGDTVFVYNGTYKENVVVNKTINLTGEDETNTTIDGSGSGDVLRIEADWVNVTGFTIKNAGSNSKDAGIELNNVQKCLLNDNIVITNPWVAIFLDSSSHNIVSNNTVLNNNRGVLLYSSSDSNIIMSNTAVDQTNNGISVSSSDSNTILNNNLSDNRKGIHLQNAVDTILVNNTMNNNGIGFFGSIVEHWNTHSVDTSNTVNGKPVIYWKNQNGGEIPQGAGQIILANSMNVLIQNQILSYCSHGISLGFSDGNTISNNSISHTITGIDLDESNNNVIQGVA